MERLSTLINRLRRYTHTQKFSDAVALASQRGIQTQTFVDLFNDAQNVLRGVIHRVGGDLYTKETLIDMVAGQESYDLPTDAFLGVNVVSVEYKYGDTGEYRKLEQRSLHMRNTRRSGTPRTYVHRNDNVLINPLPDKAVTDGLRVTYEFKQPDVDVRRGAISAVDDGDNPTSITIATSTLADIALSSGSDVAAEYITVVDKHGVQRMAGIPVSSFNTSTGVISLDSFTPATGSLSVRTGDYVVMGANASSHSAYPDFCEAFLVEYTKHGVLSLLKDPEMVASERKMQSLLAGIQESFAQYNADIQYIEMLDENRRLDSGGDYYYEL